MLKVLWFSHRDIRNPNSGGAERNIYEVGKRLVEMGHEVIWVSVSWKNCKLSEEFNGLKIVRIKNNIVAHMFAPVLIKKVVPDVIVDDLGHVVPWFSEKFSKIPGTLSFYHLHARSLPGQVSFPLIALLSIFERSYPIAYKKWPFVVDSESAKKDLVNMGVNKNRIRLIKLGVDESWFLNHQKSTLPTLVYFGGMRDYKRPWEPLFLLKNLIKEYNGIKLFMVGEGPSLAKVKKISIDLKLENHVHFTGRLHKEKLQKVVSSAWVNIHTSVTEGFGLSIIESSASGTPTVAYKVPGVIDAVEEGENGFCVENGSLEELTKKVIYVIEHFNGKLEMSSRKVANRYSWNITSRSWESHLLSLIHQ